MIRIPHRVSSAVIGILAFASFGSSWLQAKAPDLTAGERAPFGDIWFNLGPTGVQAWVYRGEDQDPNNKRRKMRPTVTTEESRQILVQSVEEGSPADGVLKVGDVILGVDGKGAKPAPFSSDARLAFANAIVDAEARNPATLNLSVWRAGKVGAVTVTLRTMGAYSDTAPYNCPKSAKILEEGLEYAMAHENQGYAGLSTLALLAANDPTNPKNTARQKKAQEYAYTQLLDPQLIDYIKQGNIESSSSIAWDRGLRLMVLCEYYLKTKDPKVMPSIEAIALSIAHGQGANGAVGHRFNISLEEGVYNEPFTIGYTMNASTLPTAVGLVLARKCGVAIPELEPAIDRVVTTLAATYGLGSFNYYVEGRPLEFNNEDNGKSGLGALCFAMQKDRTKETRYFSKLCTGATIDRGRGHIINYFGFAWTPLGANVGGEHAMANYFSQIKAEMDLCRHWDGGFEYERHNWKGKDPSMNCRGMWMSTAALLTYAVPLKQIEITGRSYAQRPELVLSDEEVAEAVLSDHYDPTKRSTKELLQDLKSDIPRLSSMAAKEIAARPEEASELAPAMIDHLKIAEPTETMGICRALGEMASVEAIPALIKLLSHEDRAIRYLSAEALTKVPPERLREHLDALLEVVGEQARPAYPLDPEDPHQYANLMLCKVVIGNWGHGGPIKLNIEGIDRDLLYPAIRAWATHPHAEARNRVARIFNVLTPEDVIALSDVIIDCAGEMSLTGAASMPGDVSIELLHREGMAEGVALAKTHIINQRFKKIEDTLKLLEEYGVAAAGVKPDPQIAEFLQDMLVGQYNGQVHEAYREQITRMRDALLAAQDPPELKTLKQLVIVEAADPILKLPAKQTQLKVGVTDLAGGKTIYTWRKLHGPGKCTFSVNGTTESASPSVTFDGTLGRYLFEVTAGDSRELTEVSGTVMVELRNAKGALPPNKAPIASSQSVLAEQALPMPVALSAKDPEGYELIYEIVSVPAHGTLSGSAPNLTYLPDFHFTGFDHFTYRVMDSDGQWSPPAEVKISIKPRSAPVAVAVYEPMDYPVGQMKGASGDSEFGFQGPWDIHHRTHVAEGNLSLKGVPTKGRSVSAGWGGSRPLDPSALAGNGLLDDGAELWISCLAQFASDGGRMSLDLGLANNGIDDETKYLKRDGDQAGQGVGINISLGTKAMLYGSEPGINEWGNRCRIKGGETGMLVAKIKWGKELDVMEVYVPQADMSLLSPISTLRTKVDQASFDTMILKGSIQVDEIRMGPTLQSVLLGTVPMSAK